MLDTTLLGCISPVIADQMPWFFPVLAVVLGGVFGSFFTCAFYRVPKGLSLWSPPSSCPHCKKTLKPIDLVPVASWVLFRGKCRMCGTKVSPKYFLVEVVSIGLALLALHFSGPQLSFIWAYGVAMAAWAVVVFEKSSKKATILSVAFGLLCFVIYVAFQQPLFACGG